MDLLMVFNGSGAYFGIVMMSRKLLIVSGREL